MSAAQETQVLQLDESAAYLRIVDGPCVAYEGTLTGSFTLTTHGTVFDIKLDERKAFVSGHTTAVLKFDGDTVTLTTKELPLFDRLTRQGVDPDIASDVASLLPDNTRLVHGLSFGKVPMSDDISLFGRYDGYEIIPFSSLLRNGTATTRRRGPQVGFRL
jgi:hypothetical protein